MLACFGLPQAAPEDSPSPLTPARRRRQSSLGSNVGSERSASLSRPSLDRRSSGGSVSGGTTRLRRSKQGVLRLVLLAIAGLTSNRPAHPRPQRKAQQQHQGKPPTPCDDSPAQSPSAQQLDPAPASSRADDLAATQTLSFLDSEVSSSVPASEFVFSVLPAKSTDGPAKSSTGRSPSGEDAGSRDAGPLAQAAPVAGGRQPAANTILKPMASVPAPPRSLSGRLPSLRRPLASSKSLPSPAQLAYSAASTNSCKQQQQPSQQQLSPAAPPLPPPPSLANSRRPLKHLPSLTPSDRSYGSSLLSAAFDRHDTKTSAHVDTSSSRSDAASPRTAGGASSSTTSSSSSSAAPSSVPSSYAATSPRMSPFFSHRKGVCEPATDKGSPDRQGAGRASQQGQQQQRQQAEEEVPLGPHEAAALRVARGFSEAFLKALSEGDTKWGSNPQLSGLFAESARMLTHDGQLFNGRTAIIRRLNAGMEQLHKMLGSVAGDAGGGEAEAQPAAEGASNATEGGAAAPQAFASMASKVHHSMDIQLLPPANAANGAAKGPGTLRSLLGRVFFHNAASSGKANAVRRRPTPHSSASASGGGTVRVVVVHSFRFGLRRFRLQDHFAVRGGAIIRLKRTRG